MRRHDFLKWAAALWCGRRDGTGPPRAAQPLAGLTPGTRTEGHWNTTATTRTQAYTCSITSTGEKLQG